MFYGVRNEFSIVNSGMNRAILRDLAVSAYTVIRD